MPAPSASIRASTPVFDGLWTRVNALMFAGISVSRSGAALKSRIPHAATFRQALIFNYTLWAEPLKDSGAARFLAPFFRDSDKRGGVMISLRAFLTGLSETGVLRNTSDKLFGGALILLAAMATADSAFPAEMVPLTGPELDALLAKGLTVSSTDMLGGKHYTAHMTYASDGTLSGAVTITGRAPIDLKGTWKIDGPRLCRTIIPFQPEEICETWLKSGSNEVTIRVGSTDMAVSRW